MAVHRNSQHAFGRFLADDILVKLGDNLTRAGDLGEQLLARSTTFALLIQDGLTEFNTFAADVDVPRALD